MRKLILIIFVGSLLSCDNRTTQQKALDEYNHEKAEMLKYERYIDSLVNVAYGVGDFRYQREERYNAIDILKKEYPQISYKLDSIRVELYKGNF